jgi:FtsP/CotA-like multicopper oxidase with cupredoxin domain
MRKPTLGPDDPGSAKDPAAKPELVMKVTEGPDGASATMDIVLELSNPGKWMAHCHVAEHLGTGMMFAFTVDP